MGIARKVAYNTIVQTVGRGFSILLSLILIKYLTGYLGINGYGQYVTATTFVGILAIVADFGLSMIVVRELVKLKEKQTEYLANVFGLRVVAALLTMLAGVLLASFFPYSDQVKMGILIVALASYLLSLNQVFVGVFQANIRIDKAVIGDTIGRFIGFAITLVSIWLKLGLTYVFVAVFIGNLVNLAISWFLVRQYIKPGFRYDPVAWKRLFWEMLPMGGVVVLGMIYYRSDMVILSAIKGEHDTGIYGLAYKFMDILVALPQFFMGAMLPFIAKYYIEDKERFKFVINRSLEVLLIAVMPVVFIFMILPQGIVRLIADSRFDPAVWPIRVLIVGVLLSFLTQVANYSLIATKKQNKLVWLYIFLIVENIGLNLWLIPIYSYKAAAVTTALTELFAIIGSWYIVRRELNLKPQVKSMGWIFLAGILGSLVTYLFRGYFWLALFSGVLVYGSLLLATNVISRDKLMDLFGRKAE